MNFTCHTMKFHNFHYTNVCTWFNKGVCTTISLYEGGTKKDSSWFPHIMYAITKSKIVPPIYCCLVQFAMLIYYYKTIESSQAEAAGDYLLPLIWWFIEHWSYNFSNHSMGQLASSHVKNPIFSLDQFLDLIQLKLE